MGYAEKRDFPKMEDMIDLKEAAAYLDCSWQWLRRTLSEGDHELCPYFRFYAGKFRTTKLLLQEYFTNSSVVASRKLGDKDEVETLQGM